MRSMMTILPWFIPVLVLSIVVALLVARPLARVLHTRPVTATWLIVGLGAVLGATIPPDRGGLDGLVPIVGLCDLTRYWLASPMEYLRIGDTSLNVILFVPFGVGIGLLPSPPSRRAIIGGALLLPLLIEATQAIVPFLGRGCESADVVDNMLGVALGFAIGRVGHRFLVPDPPGVTGGTE